MTWTFAAAAGTTSQGRDQGGLARVRAAGVLRWGADVQGGEPYAYADPDDPGKLVGFEVELAAALARHLGVKAQMVQADWSNLVPTLERGTFDVALNGLEVTPARAGRVLFTRPYYVFSERLMVRKDQEGVTDLTSLHGRRIGTLANSLAHDLLKGRAVPVFYEGVEEPFLDLVEGRTDGVLLDDIITSRYGEPRPMLRVVGDVAEGFYAVATRPREVDLRNALDEALERITKEGELRAILERAHLWNPRQERLAAWSEVDQGTLLGRPPEAPPFGWGHVKMFLRAAAITLLVSALAMALAAPLGLAVALLRRYGPSWARALGSVYVELFRGTPVLLQLYVLYFGLAPLVRIDALTAAVVGLGLNYGAYEAEVYRAGLQAVPSGQLEAGLVLGMPLPVAVRRIVLPQAVRLALPNVTNDFIALLKDSSLVSVITVVELTKQMTITAVDVRGWLVPGAMCAALYLALSYPLARRARALEARLAR